MTTREAWVSDELWQKIEDAQEVIDEAGRAAYAEAGKQQDLAAHLLDERAAIPGTRLHDAVREVCVYSYTMAHALKEGWEPVPGRPGLLQPRTGGPLPIAERRDLAEELGIPRWMVEEHGDDDDPTNENKALGEGHGNGRVN